MIIDQPPAEVRQLNTAGRQTETRLGKQALGLYINARQHPTKDREAHRFGPHAGDYPRRTTLHVAINTHRSSVPGANGIYAISMELKQNQEHKLKASDVMALNITIGPGNLGNADKQSPNVDLSFMNFLKRGNDWAFYGQFGPKHEDAGGLTSSEAFPLGLEEINAAENAMKAQMDAADDGVATNYVQKPF